MARKLPTDREITEFVRGVYRAQNPSTEWAGDECPPITIDTVQRALSELKKLRSWYSGAPWEVTLRVNLLSPIMRTVMRSYLCKEPMLLRTLFRGEAGYPDLALVVSVWPDIDTGCAVVRFREWRKEI